MYARAPRCTGCLPEILATTRGHGARLCLIDTAPHAESPALEAHDFEPVRPDQNASRGCIGALLRRRRSRPPACFIRLDGCHITEIQTSRHVTLRQLARAQPKGLNFRVFLREKCTCCELLSFSKLLELNDWQNAVTSCPTVPNDLLERERFYCKHRCSHASTSGKLSEVLMSEII